MNPNLQKLQAYPFERLSALKKHILPPSDLNHISLSIGEPKHSAPSFVKDVLANSIDEIEKYPPQPEAPWNLELLSATG